MVGLLFIVSPDGTLACSTTSATFGDFAPAPETDEQLWLSLGFAYMVVITGICLVVQADVVRYRPLMLVLAAGKAASSLTSLGFYLFDDDVFAYLLNFLVDGFLALWRCCCGRRRPGGGARSPHLKARAGAGGRRAAYPARPAGPQRAANSSRVRGGDGAGLRGAPPGRQRRRPAALAAPGRGVAGYLFDRDPAGHKYGIQITMDQPQWGGLSGCTFEEAVSWRKIAPNARFATVNVEATVALPLIVSALAEKKAHEGRMLPNLDWEYEKAAAHA